MNLVWSKYSRYCVQCGRAFRVSTDTIKNNRKDGQVTEAEAVKAVVWCLECVVGSGVPGEIIRPEEVAVAFSNVIREWLSPAELRKAIRDNRTELDTHVCHTHDHCDANMAMAEAFESLGLATPGDEMGEGSFSLWNAAWEIAIKAEFDPARVPGMKLAKGRK